MPVANRVLQSGACLELFESNTRNNQWRYWDEPSSCGTRKKRLSVVQFLWSEDSVFKRPKIDRMLFDDFFVALMPRVDSPHHGEGANARHAISGSRWCWRTPTSSSDPGGNRKTVNSFVQQGRWWMTRIGCAARASLEYREPAAARRPVGLVLHMVSCGQLKPLWFLFDRSSCLKLKSRVYCRNSIFSLWCSQWRSRGSLCSNRLLFVLIRLFWFKTVSFV